MAWTLHVDRGGTFTDVVAVDASGRVELRKLLSQREDGQNPVALACAGLDVDELRVGTTVATNALLERRGAPVLLLVTAGFRDLLEIGTQQRPGIFDLAIVKPAPLQAAVAEIDERVASDGSVARAPAREQLAAALAGWEHVAVCFLNAWANPAHEILVRDVALACGVRSVTLSHEAAPMVGALARCQTTLADAYLTPVLAASLADATACARRSLGMQSSGGLVDVATFRGKDAVLSGPAGGVVASLAVGRLAGVRQVVGLDMGGTSTDLCRCDGELPLHDRTEVGGLTIAAPSVGLRTLAAGGGSILSRRDGLLAVGPASAGALPGPACYGHGGPATLTDANVVLGRLLPEHFPHLRLDAPAARAALAAFGEPEELAAGFLSVALDAVAGAITSISVEQGYDLREHTLVAFGGAGGGHAAAVARALGIGAVIVHPLAGVLSAWGLSLARLTCHASRPVAPGAEPSFPEALALAALAAQGARATDVVRRVDVRCRGQDAVLCVPWSPDWREVFQARHRALFGFVREDLPLEIVVARVEALGPEPPPPPPPQPVREHAATPLTRRDGLGVYERRSLGPGARLTGPALVVEDHATTVVEHGWELRVDGHGQLLLEDRDPAGGDPLPRWPRPGGGRARTPAETERPPAETAPNARRAADDVTLAVLSHRFMAIAEQMGERLRRTAISTNIKERRDFSCALFDGRGQLIANAPHIPVHLGAMGETVRHLLASRELRDGDVWLSNDPFHGGSHLPDITVVSPVFREGRLAFCVANRGHHADVGGSTPGSMPPDSRSIHDEGALLDGVLLLRDGQLREEDVAARLRAAGTRGLRERLADLSAQAASNAEGARQLHELCDRRGTADVLHWMAAVLDHGEAVMARVLAGLRGGTFEDGLDDGSRIAVAITVADGRARIDFSGTSPAVPGNRNAPRAVTLAAVLYVFRTLAARPIPLNEGCARRLHVIIPPGSLLDPSPPAAVVGGNVETSQRVVDVLYGALGVLAASQGTMNNLTFGDASFGAYETICGGAGAGFGFDGASAVHTHMTNTAITDPEVLEQRLPVLVRRFEIRRGSGGAGVWRGGDGVRRELQFLRPLSVHLLAERRATAPFGLRAGSASPGREVLSSGSALIETPGGGGFTPSAEQWAAMDPTTARRLFAEGRWRGPTRGIALGARRARLLVLAEADVEDFVARLPPGALLFRGAPGQALVGPPLGPADLRRALPLYVRRRGGREVWRDPVLALGAGEAVLLLAARDEDEEPEVPAADHAAGAPARLFLGSSGGQGDAREA